MCHSLTRQTMQCTPTLNELYREQKRLHSPTQWALYTWSKCMICLFLSTLPPPHSSNITVVTKTCIRELLWKKKKKNGVRKIWGEEAKYHFQQNKQSPLFKSHAQEYIYLYIYVYICLHIYIKNFIFFLKDRTHPEEEIEEDHSISQGHHATLSHPAAPQF